MNAKIKDKLFEYRFELLLVALLLLLFDRAFFTDLPFFAKYMWPFNMMVLAVASSYIFKERMGIINLSKNILMVVSVLIPLFFGWVSEHRALTQLAFGVYIAYYLLIFVEVLRQIFERTESNLSVIFGSICGYLILIVLAQFTFLFLEFNFQGSFSNIQGRSIPKLYDQLSYFSMVTLTTVGYGDISPITQGSRLLTMLFTIVGQFYMVALVGIIISRFTGKRG